MRIALCQINTIQGDIAGNVQKIKQACQKAAAQEPDLLVFPELCINGYPCRDLLEQRWFQTNGLAALDEVAAFSRTMPDAGILVGVAHPDAVHRGKGVYNSAVLICNGTVIFRQHKSLLPTYDVFDELRYFDRAPDTALVPFKGEKLGITICEDAWNAAGMWDRTLYDFDPVKRLAMLGATVLINISASPFHLGKQGLRMSLVKNHARTHRLPFVFVNLTGGNDEIIFDGTSMFFDGTGKLCAVLPAFAEGVRVVDTSRPAAPASLPDLDTIGQVHDALVMGIRDYLDKCGITAGVCLGLSGGIDSAVTCALAVHALGPDKVLGIAMPSRFSSEGSVADARSLAENLGIRFKIIPIEAMFSPYIDQLSPHFEGRKPDITEENLQARIRGTILMAMSNKFGSLLLSTGNKSEMAVGYCTLYGDMNGGLSVISDLPKGKVYELAHYINRAKEIIPSASITKAPSAELRENQKDQDTLPPYDILDGILNMLIEDGASTDEIMAKGGFDRKTVEWVVRTVARQEFKRRQAAPGLRVTPKAFGIGRRFPIAARYVR